MFIRPHYRTKNGKRHAYWALMESYRTERGPRQRVVAYLGQLDEAHRLGVQQAAAGTAGARQKRLFDDTRPTWVEVDVKRVRVENRRAFRRSLAGAGIGRCRGAEGVSRTDDAARRGGCPLVADGLGVDRLSALRAVERTAHIGTYLHSQRLGGPLGHSAGEDQRATSLPRAGRAVAAQGGVGDFLEESAGRTVRPGVRPSALRRDEHVLRGPGWRNPQARRGYSRDHRPDCKQVCIGLVVPSAGCHWATRCSPETAPT